MSEQNEHINLSKKSCINFDTMKAYLRSQLSASEMHKVEQHLLSCQFCSDAFDGLSDTEDVEKHFITIENISEEIIEKAINTKVLRPTKKRPFIIAAVAAALVLVFSIAFLFKPVNLKNQNQLADAIELEKPEEENKLPVQNIVVEEVSEKNEEIAVEEEIADEKIELVEETIVNNSQLAENTVEKEEKSLPAEINTETGIEEENDIAVNEATAISFEIEEAEVTNESNIYNPNKVEATRTLGKNAKSEEISSTNLTNNNNLLKLLDEKVVQNDYSAALNIIYQLENSTDAEKLKLRLNLTRARIFAAQFNKSMGLNYLKSINDSEITSSSDYKALLDSLSN